MRNILLTAVMVVSLFAFSQENNIKKQKPQLQTSTSINTPSTVNPNYEERRTEAAKIKKTKYIQFSSTEYRTVNNIPSDFPKYKDTGDVVKDTETYDLSLKEWIKNNEDKYSEIKEIINF